MRLILVFCLVAMLAIPAAAVGGQSASSSSQGAAAQGAAKASNGEKGKQRKRKQQNRRSTARGATTAQASSSSSSSSATDDEVEVKGPIVSLSPLTVGTTSCVVPTGFSLLGFALGDVVEMTCDLVGGQWVLRKVHLEDAPRGKVEVKGVVTSLSPLTVAGVSCVVPTGMLLTGIAVGNFVEMKCRLVGGQWVVRKVELEDDDDDNSGPGHGDDDDDDDNSGRGDGDDDDDDDDNSGRGGGDDDDNNSGPGDGDDD